MSNSACPILDGIRKTVPINSKVLIAVSGGADSVALFAGCLSLAEELSMDIHVAHLDHNLRDGSAKDAEFVSKLVSEAGVKFYIKTADEPDKGNVEAWGRRVRYSFFRETLGQENLDYVLTAHTANDVAETLLMRLVSNKELRGISRVDEGRRLIRPLIDCTRDEVESYLELNSLSHVEDETNRDTSYLRSRVRHKLLPFLSSEFEGDTVRLLGSRAKAVAEDLEFLDSLIEPIVIELRSLEFGTKDWMRLVRSRLEQLPAQLQWRLSEALLRDKLGFRLGRAHATRATAFLLGECQGVQLPGSLNLRSKAGGCELN